MSSFESSMFTEYWHLGLSDAGYEQSDIIGEQDGQTQAPFNSAYNLSLEPDEALDLDLESPTFTGDQIFTNTKRHTMPDFGIPQSFSSTSFNNSLQLTSNSPKRSETYPSTPEGPSITRNRILLDLLSSKIDPVTAPTSPQSSSQASDTTNVAQSLPVDPIAGLGCEEWPVPTFFLDHIDGPTTPGLDRTDEHTPDELENSPQAFANTQYQGLEYLQTNDQYSMAEDMDSVPPLLTSSHKVPNSDSGIGSSAASYPRGPQSIMAPSYKNSQGKRGGNSSNRGSQAKGSVLFDKGSMSGFPSSGVYQQAAAKLGPLTSAASSTARSVATQKTLSEIALETMKTIILEPILVDPKFRDFWHICTMAGEQMDTGQIGSLRDLEKFLFHKASNQKNNQAYNTFCREFLSHVKESLNYMPQNELLRSYDRPYDPGYFMDIMAPFNKSTIPSFMMEIAPEEDEDYNPEFERWLHSTNECRPEKRNAETHMDDGNASKRSKPNQPIISIQMNDEILFGHGGYEGIPIGQGGDLQDFIRAPPLPQKPGSMGPPALPASARKSSNPPIAVALARQPKGRGRRRCLGNQQKEPSQYRCDWPDCSHEPFNRACDLTKHQKTHTRPHKCSVAGCKYSTQGFPTEKERDRHWTDKHSQEAPSYHCLYPPCTYKSKRDSNRKQHMENTHGYKYVRTKQNYKTNDSKRQSTSPTSPTSQASPTGSSPQDSLGLIASHTTSHYQTTDGSPSAVSGFSPGVKERYTMEDVEILKRLLIDHNQAAGHSGQQQQHNLTIDTFGNQGFIPGAGSLPYPDSLDPSYLGYTPMPDGNIDPDL